MEYSIPIQLINIDKNRNLSRESTESVMHHRKSLESIMRRYKCNEDLPRQSLENNRDMIRNFENNRSVIQKSPFNMIGQALDSLNASLNGDGSGQSNIIIDMSNSRQNCLETTADSLSTLRINNGGTGVILMKLNSCKTFREEKFKLGQYLKNTLKGKSAMF